MFFGKKVQEAPSITNEQQYIEWFVRYSDKVAHLRNLAQYKKHTDAFVNASVSEALILLKEYPSADALFDRVGHLSASYEKTGKPVVEKAGGLDYCSPQFRGAVVSMLMNVFIGIEILKKKYKHKETIALFGN